MGIILAAFIIMITLLACTDKIVSVWKLQIELDRLKNKISYTDLYK